MHGQITLKWQKLQCVILLYNIVKNSNPSYHVIDISSQEVYQAASQENKEEY